MSEQSKEVEKFDPSKLMDGVRDRIKATFVSLIPDDQWETMCKSAMDQFFAKRRKQNGYNNWEDQPSEFEELVTTMMKERTKELLVEFFKDPKYSVESIYKFNNNTQNSDQEATMSDHLDKMIKKKMPDMLNSMLTNVMANAFHQLFQNVNNNMQNYR